jgi:hypothetical protein
VRRRALAGSIFVFVIVLVAVGVHAYLIRRHALDPAWPVRVRTAILAVLASGFTCLFLYPFGRHRVPRRVTRAWAWTASIWLGIAFLLFTTTVASEGVLWLLGAAAPAGEPDAWLRTRSAAVAAVAAMASGIALRSGLAPPALRRVEVRLAHWPRALDGLRVLQLSDLHLGPLLDRRFAAALVERGNALRPDLVVVTGDLVDGSVGRVADEVAPLAGLRARHGVFFVTGNHDFYSGADAWAENVREFGWRVLRNQRVTIRHGEAAFELAGVDDHHGALVSDAQGEDLDRALAGRDPSRPLVLLAHDPTTFHRASSQGVDLQISGHTHGGQIWPFQWVVRLVVPWVAGLHRRGDSVLYVSRGTGFWGPPMRLLAPAELTELVLRAGGGPQPDQNTLRPELASQGPTVSSTSLAIETES